MSVGRILGASLAAMYVACCAGCACAPPPSMRGVPMTPVVPVESARANPSATIMDAGALPMPPATTP